MTGITSPDEGYVDGERASFLRVNKFLCSVLGYVIIEPAVCIYFQDNNSVVIYLPSIHPEDRGTIQSLQLFLVTYSTSVLAVCKRLPTAGAVESLFLNCSKLHMRNSSLN